MQAKKDAETKAAVEASVSSAHHPGAAAQMDMRELEVELRT